MSEYVIGNVFESNVIGVYRYELLVSCAKVKAVFSLSAGGCRV